MENEINGENQPNQEQEGENNEEINEEINEENDEEEFDVEALKKENETLKAQKAHWKKKAEAKNEPEKKVETKETEAKSDEPDYSVLAYLNSKGIEHPDDQKIIQDEAARIKMPLHEVLDMEHIKAKLKNAKDQREAESGMPKGNGRPGSSNKQDVDYYLAKGTTPDDLELAEKVIAARMKKEANASKFSDELYTE